MPYAAELENKYKPKYPTIERKKLHQSRVWVSAYPFVAKPS